MQIIGLQDAIKARKEKNMYSIYEITTTPGLAERIEYLLSPGGRVVDKLVFVGLQSPGRFDMPQWEASHKGEKFDLLLNDMSCFKVQFKSVVRPNDSLANLKYTLGA